MTLLLYYYDMWVSGIDHTHDVHLDINRDYLD